MTYTAAKLGAWHVTLRIYQGFPNSFYLRLLDVNKKGCAVPTPLLSFTFLLDDIAYNHLTYAARLGNVSQILHNRITSSPLHFGLKLNPILSTLWIQTACSPIMPVSTYSTARSHNLLGWSEQSPPWKPENVQWWLTIHRCCLAFRP